MLPSTRLEGQPPILGIAGKGTPSVRPLLHSMLHHVRRAAHTVLLLTCAGRIQIDMGSARNDIGEARGCRQRAAGAECRHSACVHTCMHGVGLSWLYALTWGRGDGGLQTSLGRLTRLSCGSTLPCISQLRDGACAAVDRCPTQIAALLGVCARPHHAQGPTSPFLHELTCTCHAWRRAYKQLALRSSRAATAA